MIGRMMRVLLGAYIGITAAWIAWDLLWRPGDPDDHLPTQCTRGDQP